MEPISIYIHIPMCVKKCAYCDFTSFCGRMNQREAYTEAVCREMREQAAFFGARRVETVFFGGGTPTLSDLARLCDVFYIGGTKHGALFRACQNYRSAGRNRCIQGGKRYFRQFRKGAETKHIFRRTD